MQLEAWAWTPKVDWADMDSAALGNQSISSPASRLQVQEYERHRIKRDQVRHLLGISKGPPAIAIRGNGAVHFQQMYYLEKKNTCLYVFLVPNQGPDRVPVTICKLDYVWTKTQIGAVSP